MSRSVDPNVNEVRSLQVRSGEVVFETEIYAPSQKLFALKGGVLDPIIFDKSRISRPFRLKN
ncbi:MAG TPA: hypothetical protein DCF68_04345 [Cyanothece sp. UBA12306]|nr:hypothetical protein [Cyanothece sp. UBA12306]